MKKSWIFSLCLCAATALCRALQAELPASDILQKALLEDVPAYRGELLSIVTYGKTTSVSDLMITHQPPHFVRKEYLSPDGSMEKLVVSDGITQGVYLPGKGIAWKGDASKTQAKGITWDQEWALLTQNYAITLEGRDRVAGLEAWIISITPKSPGKPRRSLWIGRERPIILRSKEFNADGTLTTQSRFVEIGDASNLAPGLFRLALPPSVPVKDHELEPDFLSWEELQTSGLGNLALPKNLPVGFIFESGNFFTVGKKSIAHLHFTDGLTVISLFESRSPIADTNQDAHEEILGLKSGRIGSSGAGKILRWKAGKTYFTLIGDLTTPALQKIAHSIQ